MWASLSNSSSRYWALAVPALVVTAVCLYGVTYGCLALALTPRRDAPSVLRDAHARPLERPSFSSGALSPSPLSARRRRVPVFADAPPELVSAALFIVRRGEAEEPTVLAAPCIEW